MKFPQISGGAGNEVTRAAGSPPPVRKQAAGSALASEGQAGMKGGVKKTVSREKWGGLMLDGRLWDKTGGIYQLVGRNFCSLPLKQAIT